MTDFVSVLDQQARVQPGKEFLRAAGRSFSYGEFAELSRRSATVLREQGIGASDRVALLCFNTPGFALALLEPVDAVPRTATGKLLKHMLR